MKSASKQADRIPLEIKVDCYTISCQPLKSAVEKQIKELQDILSGCLQRKAGGVIETSKRPKLNILFVLPFLLLLLLLLLLLHLPFLLLLLLLLHLLLFYLLLLLLYLILLLCAYV